MSNSHSASTIKRISCRINNHWQSSIFIKTINNTSKISVNDKLTNKQQLKIGDEVYTRPHKDRIGTFAEFIAAKEVAVALKPKNISFAEAASIPLVGLTTWQALLSRASMKSVDKVFIPACFKT